MANKLPLLLLATLLPLLATSTAIDSYTNQALVPEKHHNHSKGPKLIATFFTDTACITPLPIPIIGPSRPATRDIFPHECVNDVASGSTYSSINITHIDDAFIGKNVALRIGHAESEACDDFVASVRFDVSKRKGVVGECFFIGIPEGAPGKPVVAGNEYEIGKLED